MKARHLTVSAALIAAALHAPRGLRAQEFPLARYGIVDELVLADSGEVKRTNTPTVRSDALRNQQGAVTFIVIFVVDTLGRVELPSVSFGNDVPPAFRRYACELLAEVRYAPLQRSGQLRRALMVEALGIRRGDAPDAGQVSAEALRNAVKENGVVEMLPIFAKQPHCRE